MTKRTYKTLFAILFFSFSVLNLIGIAGSIQWLRFLSKPMLMICLSALYLASSNIKNKWYIGALIFSLFGDIFLLDKSNLFLFGVGSFLVAQLLYIKIFSKQIPKHNWTHLIKALLPFLVYLLVLMKLLSPSLGPLFFPVLIYGITISIFGAVSLLNYLLRKDKRSAILLSGAVLFIGSDSMIALNKFHESSIVYPAAIMLTYILAQYLIFNYVIATELNPR